MANPSSVDGHRITLAHCTIAPKLTTDFQYRTHFESGLGIAIAGTLKKGKRVTIARLNKSMDILRAGEGTITAGKAWSDELCRTQIEIRMDGDADIIKTHSIGNHYVATYGEHTRMLKTIADLLNIRFEKI